MLTADFLFLIYINTAAFLYGLHGRSQFILAGMEGSNSRQNIMRTFHYVLLLALYVYGTYFPGPITLH